MGIPDILPGLTTLEKIRPFSVGGEINFPTTDGVCGHPLAQHNCARTGHAHIARTDVWVTRTRVAQAHSAELHALVPQKVVVIHAQCSTCFRTCHRTLLHDLSNLHQLSSDHLLPHCPVLLQLHRHWIKIPCEIHGGVAGTLNLHLPQVMSPNWSNLTITSFKELNWTEILGQMRIKYQKEFWEMTIKIYHRYTEETRKFLVSTCPTSNQGYTPITIQLKALQTRILKMENYEKCWTHRCMCMGGEKLWFFSQTHSFRETTGKSRREGQVHNVLKLITLQERESLKSNSSQDPRASGKPDAVFSSRSDEQGNQFESSMFKYDDPSKLGRSLLEGDEDHLLSQARSELIRQEHQGGSPNALKDLNCRTIIMDLLNLEENKLEYKKIFLWRKTFPRYSNTKYSWIGWDDESSRTSSWRILTTKITRKSWNNTETHLAIAVFSRTNEFNERFRGIQEVESNHSGRLFHVPMLSRDKSVPFDVWDSLGLQEERFLVIKFLHLVREEIMLKESLWCDTRCYRTRNTKRDRISSTSNRNRDLFPKRWRAKIKAQFQCRCLREGRRPWVRQYRWTFRRTPWLDSKDSNYRSCNSTKFPTPASFLCWKIRFRNQVTTFFSFSIGNFVMDQRNGDVRFIGRIKILAIGCWKEFSKLWHAGREDCFCFE